MARAINKLWFSQASLSAWLTCPLKFRYRYVDGLYWPLPSSGSLGQRLELGRQFHLLAQHYYADGEARLPAGVVPELGQWLQALQSWLPRTGTIIWLPEYELRLNRGGLRLLAKYDLLAISEGAVTIYDWKTDDKAPASVLDKTPQTRLYLYLLSQLAGKVHSGQPENLSMVYWNPRFADKPLAIPYSRRQQQADGLWLEGVVAEIVAATEFPATADQDRCRRCEYRPVCHGRELAHLEGDDPDWEELDLDWEQIEEVDLQGVNML